MYAAFFTELWQTMIKEPITRLLKRSEIQPKNNWGLNKRNQQSFQLDMDDGITIIMITYYIEAHRAKAQHYIHKGLHI